jgi:hypothetical protein
MGEEIAALKCNNTWDLVTHPPIVPIMCKWVNKIKTHSDGSIERYKSCLVAYGFQFIVFFTYVQYHRFTSSDCPRCHLGRQFHHIFVFVHHDYFVYADNSKQHRHSPYSPLYAPQLSRRPLLILSNTDVCSWWSLPSCIRYWQHRCVH